VVWQSSNDSKDISKKATLRIYLTAKDLPETVGLEVKEILRRVQ
jgi:hypothetical protein